MICVEQTDRTEESLGAELTGREACLYIEDGTENKEGVTDNS